MSHKSSLALQQCRCDKQTTATIMNTNIKRGFMFDVKEFLRRYYFHYPIVLHCWQQCSTHEYLLQHATKLWGTWV